MIIRFEALKRRAVLTPIHYQEQMLKCSVTDLNNKTISLINSKATDREETGKNIQTLTPDLEHFIAQKFVGGSSLNVGIRVLKYIHYGWGLMV